MKTLTREEWFKKVTDKFIRPHFKKAGYDIPKNIRSSCSFPSVLATSKNKRRIGECWSPDASDDQTFEIFISPLYDDSEDVLGTLIHELVHATVGLAAGHKKPFRDCAISVGLTGKMTATTSTDDLITEIKKWVEKVGDYPHAKLKPNNDKKQTTRNIKLECHGCGYIIRTTRKWLIESSVPVCGDCGQDFQVCP